jgi:hypothetical protein
MNLQCSLDPTLAAEHRHLDGAKIALGVMDSETFSYTCRGD